MAYKHILLAADFNPDDDDPVVKRAKELAQATNAKLSLIHVIEYPYNYGAPYEIPTMVEWQAEVEKAAKEELARLGKKLSVPADRQHMHMGVPRTAILEMAEQIRADLIIVGSHGRHGLQLLLLGSTANGIIHSAKCDVLAVRVGKKET